MKARLLVTLKCHRTCSYCCNNHQGTKEAMRVCRDKEELLKYDDIMLSGGEPLLYFDLTLALAAYYRTHGKRVFLYTTLWPRVHGNLLLHQLDGIQYSLHSNAWSAYDHHCLERLQEDLLGWEGSSRLAIEPGLKHGLILKPERWDSISTFEIMGPGECPVPEDSLYVLRED